MFSRTCVPLIACQKSILRPYSRSVPFSGACVAAASLLPPNNWLKISWNPPTPSAGAASALRRLAPRAIIGEIESAEAHVRPPGARLAPPGRPPESVLRIEAVLVVHLPLLRLAQNVVGFLDFFEAVLGGFIARVQIGMMFARKFPVGLADLFRTCAARSTPRVCNNRPVLQAWL